MSEDTAVIYEAGYAIEVHSWENDADHPREVRFSVPDAKTAVFCAYICELLSKSYHGENGYYGNIPDIYSKHEDGSDPLNIATDEFYRKVFERAQSLKIEDVECNDHINEVLGDLGLTSEHYVTRYCYKWEVYHSPVDVRVQLITKTVKEELQNHVEKTDNT